MPYANKDPSRVYDQVIEAKMAKQQKHRLCLKCLNSFSSFGPQNRICESCNLKIMPYIYSQETFAISAS